MRSRHVRLPPWKDKETKYKKINHQVQTERQYCKLLSFVSMNLMRQNESFKNNCVLDILKYVCIYTLD